MRPFTPGIKVCIIRVRRGKKRKMGEEGRERKSLWDGSTGSRRRAGFRCSKRVSAYTYSSAEQSGWVAPLVTPWSAETKRAWCLARYNRAHVILSGHDHRPVGSWAVTTMRVEERKKIIQKPSHCRCVTTSHELRARQEEGVVGGGREYHDSFYSGNSPVHA